MGWTAYAKNGEIFREEEHGRPVQAGEEGSLAAIAQDDFGRKVAVDLINGVIAIDYESIGYQNGTVELSSPKLIFWICDETNVVGELAHHEKEFSPYRDETGNLKFYDGKIVQVQTDVLKPLLWRPIWFTRITMGIPTKVIGAQTTLPEDYTGRNVKKMISIFWDGRIGID